MKSLIFYGQVTRLTRLDLMLGDSERAEADAVRAAATRAQLVVAINRGSKSPILSRFDGAMTLYCALVDAPKIGARLRLTLDELDGEPT